ncbi:MAG: hypothetical protein ACKVOR_09775, partial [Flavobacteriales bacterium]
LPEETPTTKIDDAVRLREELSRKKKIIDDVESGEIDLREGRKTNDYTREANYGEIKIQYDLLSRQVNIEGRSGTMTSIGRTAAQSLDEPIKKGIDGIYRFSNPPPEFIVVEVKYGSSSISRTLTQSGGKQMDQVWIGYHISDQFEDYMLIRQIMANSKSVLARVNKDSSITYDLLDESAKTIKRNWF